MESKLIFLMPPPIQKISPYCKKWFWGQIDHPLMLRILVAPGPSFEGGEESVKACAFFAHRSWSLVLTTTKALCHLVPRKCGLSWHALWLVRARLGWRCRGTPLAALLRSIAALLRLLVGGLVAVSSMSQCKPTTLGWNLQWRCLGTLPFLYPGAFSGSLLVVCGTLGSLFGPPFSHKFAAGRAVRGGVSTGASACTCTMHCRP